MSAARRAVRHNCVQGDRVILTDRRCCGHCERPFCGRYSIWPSLDSIAWIVARLAEPGLRSRRLLETLSSARFVSTAKGVMSPDLVAAKVQVLEVHRILQTRQVHDAGRAGIQFCQCLHVPICDRPRRLPRAWRTAASRLASGIVTGTEIVSP